MPHYHRIREIRLQRQASIRTLADLLGLTIREARQIEAPETDVSLSLLRQVAGQFQVSVADLIAEGDDDEVHRLRGFVIRTLKVCRAIVQRLPAGAPAGPLGECRNLAGSLELQSLELLPEADQTHPERFHGLRPGEEPGRICELTVPERSLLQDQGNRSVATG